MTDVKAQRSVLARIDRAGFLFGFVRRAQIANVVLQLLQQG
jgi:hypothetical protein